MTDPEPAGSSAGDGEEEEQFEVESVIGERTRDGRTQFLLKWKSFDSSDATWEFEEDTFCPALVEEFHAREASRLAEKRRRIAAAHLAAIGGLEELAEAAPKLVIGAFKRGGALFYRVLCADEKCHSVAADLLRSLCPRLICEFLENKIEVMPE
jgi:hypothetical protein